MEKEIELLAFEWSLIVSGLWAGPGPSTAKKFHSIDSNKSIPFHSSCFLPVLGQLAKKKDEQTPLPPFIHLLYFTLRRNNNEINKELNKK